ncbi:MAG TPA: hypothetical protein VHQ41_03190 [Patescibacteria group bacterium]|jgi:hypothetical protein|nr:hypothetical protein [Patescibacteria group bacterium]
MNEEQILRALQKRAFAAECPEEFWGTGILKSIRNVVAEEHMAEIMYIIQSATEKKTGNANYDWNMQRLLARVILFHEWAKEKLKAETYGDEVKFRLEILSTITEISGESYFEFQSELGASLLVKEIPAMMFSAEEHCDYYEIRREGQPYIIGRVSAYGTHGRAEYFMQNNSSDKTQYLQAGSFTVGHQLLIRTWQYGSAPELREMLSRVVPACIAQVTSK